MSSPGLNLKIVDQYQVNVQEQNQSQFKCRWY